MKSVKITLTFLTLCFSCYSKDSTKLDFTRFTLGIHVSPDYCYRTVKAVTASSVTLNVVEARNKNEIPMLGYTAGADFSYFIKKQFAISLGVNFSRKGYINESLYLTDQNGNIIGNGYFKYNYNYIELPLKVNFILGKKKVRFLLGAAATSSFLLYQQTNSKYEYNDGTKVISKGKPNYIYNPFNLFLTGSIGADISLGKKMGIKIEPKYSYGLFHTIDAPITEYLWNAGLNIGCYIKL